MNISVKFEFFFLFFFLFVHCHHSLRRHAHVNAARDRSRVSFVVVINRQNSRGCATERAIQPLLEQLHAPYTIHTMYSVPTTWIEEFLFNFEAVLGAFTYVQGENWHRCHIPHTHTHTLITPCVCVCVCILFYDYSLRV